jgi:hypothetical protein
VVDRFLCAVRRFARYAFLACAFFLGGAGLVAVAGRERVAPSTPCGDRTDDGGVSARGARTEGRRRGRGTKCGFSRRRAGEREYNRIVQYCAEGRMGAVAVLGVQRLQLLLTWSHDGKKVFVFFSLPNYSRDSSSGSHPPFLFTFFTLPPRKYTRRCLICRCLPLTRLAGSRQRALFFSFF